jgi:uncharacterized protein
MQFGLSLAFQEGLHRRFNMVSFAHEIGSSDLAVAAAVFVNPGSPSFRYCRKSTLNRRPSFFVGCAFELALLVLAVLWGWLFHRPALLDLRWTFNAVLIGTIAAIPPFLFFLWTLNSQLKVCSRHRELMEFLLRPLLGNWSIVQLAVISICAGISEEAFFRGAIQGSLADRVGWGWALVLSSALFGAAHLITWTYAIVAGLIGVYLGLLWMWTGNLLTPMITHAVYDFAALVYFLRIYRAK